MIEIVKLGKVKKPKYQQECKKCDTVFTYEQEDIINETVYGGYNDKYIKCPCCNTLLAHNFSLEKHV